MASLLHLSKAALQPGRTPSQANVYDDFMTTAVIFYQLFLSVFMTTAVIFYQVFLSVFTASRENKQPAPSKRSERQRKDSLLHSGTSAKNKGKWRRKWNKCCATRSPSVDRVLEHHRHPHPEDFGLHGAGNQRDEHARSSKTGSPPTSEVDGGVRD